GRHRAEAARLRSAAARGTAKVDVPSELTGVESTLGARARLFVHPPVRAELVVFAPLRRVPEHLVRFVDLLELRFSGLVPGVDVRMELARQLPERLLDFFFRRRLGDAK